MIRSLTEKDFDKMYEGDFYGITTKKKYKKAIRNLQKIGLLVPDILRKEPSIKLNMELYSKLTKSEVI